MRHRSTAAAMMFAVNTATAALLLAAGVGSPSGMVQRSAPAPQSTTATGPTTAAAAFIRIPLDKMRVLYVSDGDDYFLSKALGALKLKELATTRPETFDPAEAERYHVTVIFRKLPATLPAGGYLLFECAPPSVHRAATRPGAKESPVLRELRLVSVPQNTPGLDLPKIEKAALLTCPVFELPPKWVTLVRADANAGASAPAIFTGRDDGRTFIVVGFEVGRTNWTLKPTFPAFIAESLMYLSAPRTSFDATQPATAPARIAPR